MKKSKRSYDYLSFKDDLFDPNKMTKKQIIEELKMHGVDATLRARKSTLVELLKEKREDNVIHDGPTQWKPITDLDLDEETLKAMLEIKPKMTWVDWTSNIIAIMGATITITIGAALILHWFY